MKPKELNKIPYSFIVLQKNSTIKYTKSTAGKDGRGTPSEPRRLCNVMVGEVFALSELLNFIFQTV